jgi:hypothetical protein
MPEYVLMRIKIAFAVLPLVLGAAPVWAVLGESVRTVQRDQEFMHGALITMTRQGYAIQQINSTSGHVIKEYVSPQGSVFGISWQGPTVPDLRQFLGSYSAQLQQAIQGRSRRRGPLVVRTDQVVIEMGGHQRSFHGRAYVPSLLPNGVSEAVVQ